MWWVKGQNGRTGLERRLSNGSIAEVANRIMLTTTLCMFK
jgi:hypothetical protein